MLNKKTIFLVTLIFFVTSCADTFDSVKRGLTGTKKKSSDEFLVKKKDPLIYPPNYDSLPDPEERAEAKKEILSLEKKLGKISSNDIESSTSSSTEESILKKIQTQ